MFGRRTVDIRSSGLSSEASPASPTASLPAGVAHERTMGNSATKEQRPHPARLRSADIRSVSSPAGSGPSSPSYPPSLDRPSHPVYNVRTGRGSRPDLSTLLGIRGNGVTDNSTLETRRETKQEREARKMEKERVAREKERERSMREESVDGGYLVTQGVYTGIEDYNKGVVRQLMVGYSMDLGDA